MLDKEIPKRYDPCKVEEKWYRRWVEKGYFQGGVRSNRQAYSIVMPPPNVTGSLHMGHALNITIQDILVRWERMRGRNVLWVPGTDHAGIATQNVVERHMAEQGLRRIDLGRAEFEKRVWDWKEKAENNILRQIRRLGCSCDWSRKRFTMDDGLSRAVREVFVRLYEQGLVYRGEFLVNWCPRCNTAISDLEVDYEPTLGKLWYIRYRIRDSGDFVVVATTRPETMLGDTAVAVHPEDKRYTNLRHAVVIVPLMKREIPVIADRFVDREFGTGLVKVTPGHDHNDFSAGRRHQLPVVKVIGETGFMTEEAGEYAGLDRSQAREKVVADLERQGLLLRIEDHSHNVGHCQRCTTVVEPLVSTQWFVKVEPIAKAAIRAVEEKRTLFVPAHYERIYFEWMHNIHDWCISRQLWWGHRIPAWYCRDCKKMIVARESPRTCPNCHSHLLEQDTDVLDTWFSSALWPFSALGWPDETQELRVFYPTSVLATGFDIIFFWVARMMMMGLCFMGDVPFRTVYINGLVRDEKGQKMSKSRGNIIDPLQIIDEYGTDAMRFTLAVMAVPGTDIPFSVNRMSGYRAFCNKIWNAARFLLLNLAEDMRPVGEADIASMWKENRLRCEDRWILGRLQMVIRDTNENLSKFRFHEASNGLYHFFWHEFCDWYIELVKANITGGDPHQGLHAVSMTVYLLETSLRLLHPFIPFITEELWQRLPHSEETIMSTVYPQARPDWIDPKAIATMQDFQELIIAIRTARAENDIDPRKKMHLQLFSHNDSREFLESQRQHLIRLAWLDQIEFSSGVLGPGLRVQGVSRLADFSLVVDESIDVDVERQRLMRQIQRVRQEIQQLEKKLQNGEFLQKAPPPVVESSRLRFQEAENRLFKLKEKLDGLSQP